MVWTPDWMLENLPDGQPVLCVNPLLGAQVHAGRRLVAALGAQQRVDAQHRLPVGQVLQHPVRRPHHGAAQHAAGGHRIGLVRLGPGDHAADLGALAAGRHGRAGGIVRGGDHRVDQIGGRQLGRQAGIALDLLAQQTVGDLAPLLHPDHDEGPAEIVVGHVVAEGPQHVVIGETAGVQRVLAQGDAIGVEARLAVAGGEHPADPGERPGIVGQHDPLQLALGRTVFDRAVPVAAAVEGGRVHEEDVHRSGDLPRRLPHGVERPRRSLAIVRRLGPDVDLERHARHQLGQHDVVPGGREDHAQHDGQADPGDHAPSLEAGQSPVTRAADEPGEARLEAGPGRAHPSPIITRLLASPCGRWRPWSNSRRRCRPASPGRPTTALRPPPPRFAPCSRRP